MFLRYAKTFGLLLLLPVGCGLSLLPLLLVQPHVQFQYLLPALIAWAALYLLPLPFFLRLIIRKAWFFSGRGESVLHELLEFMLLAVNDFSNPVSVQKKRNKIRFSWRCSDPEWCQRMSLAGIGRTYELYLEFDFNTRTVIMRDRVRHVNFSLCPLKVTSGLFTSSRFFFRVRTGPEQGLKIFDRIAAV